MILAAHGSHKHHSDRYSSKHRPSIHLKAVAATPGQSINRGQSFINSRLVDLDGYDSAIEFEASELRVLAPADANASDDGDDDRPITEPSGNAPPGRFDEFAFREASAPPRSPRPEAVPESVGAMRSLIASAGLSSADCVEKSELRARSVLALERLAEAKRLRDSRSNE